MKANILIVAVASAICAFGADEVVALGYQTPGRFADQSAKPVTCAETLAAKLKRTLQPNSLTVIVFK